ncbi:tetratricopeptide repeat protein [Carboxylicivirga sp. M1479]|uniref:tetratricopeptide repeat protein n=1 Tax=Carboxylicivirga sp. M1479 TaxID=2594476 RepID=UPI0011787363|nr:tetratricopeptide repeat protein [Carboxylicivirga sp. M1479]TRX66385.1 tetratricopeptide repeat protein [Carboxylicivirga sp. M1479]
MSTLADQYYIKALDQYSYSLEEAIENLGYALSQDDEHSGANYLMGRLHHEQMNNFQKAESYYLKALAGNPDDLNVCMAYILLLIIMKEYDKAQNLITYANKLTGVDLSKTYSFQALIYESKHDYEKAISLYNEARLEAYNEDCMNHITSEIKRVKAKKKYVEKSSKDKKKKNQD